MESKGFQSTFKSKIRFNEDCFFIKRSLLKSVLKDFEGRAITVSEFAEDDPSTRYVGLKTVDFSIENQQLVGKELPVVQYHLSDDEANYRMVRNLSKLKKSMSDEKKKDN